MQVLKLFDADEKICSRVQDYHAQKCCAHYLPYLQVPPSYVIIYKHIVTYRNTLSLVIAYFSGRMRIDPWHGR